MNNQPLPLYDLHCHFGGAIPVEAVWQILTRDIQDSITLKELTHSMTYKGDAGPYGFEKFLRKFDILNSINWTEEHILVTTDASLKSIAEQDIEYVEMRFSINKYMQYLNMNMQELTLFICKALRDAGKKYKVRVAPILSIKYESSRDSQASIMGIIDDSKVADNIVGIDLVGDEAHFDADFYAPFFKKWREAGKGLIAHVGESQTAHNVREAILKMGVNRISHGIQAAYDTGTMDLANAYGVAFDCALTSNVKTGVIKDLESHPLKLLLDHGCRVSLGTDDPVILDTTIAQEYELAKRLGLSASAIEKLKQNAIDGAFL